MKRIIAIFLLIVLLCFSACTKNQAPQNTTEMNEPTASVTANETLPTENDAGGGAIIEARKYRVRYYSIPGPFADLVGREECYDWETEYAQNIILSNRMLIVDFIKHFDISKENFEKANLQLAKALGKNNKMMMNPLDYTNQEIYEVFNADIIYTFDDEIINEYYLSHDYPYLYEHEYEEALANGTYQTRTTDWVDIEQMEADIIAKYGEAEIVTEEPVTETESASTTETISDVSEMQTT